MKRIMLRALIFGVFLWVYVQAVAWNALASDMRGFANWQELEQWLELKSQTSAIIALRNNACVQTANGVIGGLNKDGYLAEQYTITAPLYFYEWYPQWWGFGDGGHAIVRVKVGSQYYLIEPTYWMAWQYDESRAYVGYVSGWK